MQRGFVGESVVVYEHLPRAVGIPRSHYLLRQLACLCWTSQPAPLHLGPTCLSRELVCLPPYCQEPQAVLWLQLLVLPAPIALMKVS